MLKQFYLKKSIYHKSYVCCQFKYQTVLFVLSGATTPDQSGPGSDGNEGILCIPQISSIISASPSNRFVSYQDTHWSVLPLCRDLDGVFFSSSRLRYPRKELHSDHGNRIDERCNMKYFMTLSTARFLHHGNCSYIET